MKDEWMRQYLGSGEITVPWSQFELQTLRHLREPDLGQLSWVIFTKSPLAKSNIQGLSTQAISIMVEPPIGWWQEVTNLSGFQVDTTNLDPPLYFKPTTVQQPHPEENLVKMNTPQRSSQASCWPSGLWENQGKEIQYQKSPEFDKRVCKKIGWTKC